MERSTNALAELAKDLEEIVRDTKSDFYTTAISKAQRIIEELAKVGDGRWVNDYYAGWFYVCRAEHRVVETVVGNCLAIAEEGVKDGK